VRGDFLNSVYSIIRPLTNGPKRQKKECKFMKIDVFVKSRHSGLSGIGCFFNVLEKKGSGQAGMTASKYYRTALLVMAVLCLSLFSCAPKEVLRRAGPAPYEGMVTVEALQQSVGFGDVRSIKALAEVTVYKQGSN